MLLITHKAPSLEGILALVSFFPNLQYLCASEHPRNLPSEIQVPWYAVDNTIKRGAMQEKIVAGCKKIFKKPIKNLISVLKSLLLNNKSCFCADNADFIGFFNSPQRTARMPCFIFSALTHPDTLISGHVFERMYRTTASWSLGPIISSACCLTASSALATATARPAS